jgi:hypothetical protein
MPEPRMTIPRLPSRARSPPARETRSPAPRPPYGRTTTFEGTSRSSTRDMSPLPRLTRVPTEPTSVLASRAGLRPVRQTSTFDDQYAEEYAGTNGNRRDRSPPSPATSHGSVASRAASWSQSTSDLAAPGSVKKAPPPPPPSRSKKPAPPPPPMKRSALSASETSHY